MLIIGGVLLIWSVFIEPYILTQTTYTLKNNQLKGLKIVYISDMHTAPYQHWFLKRIVDQVNALNPDIILLGGDFVKGHRKKSLADMNDIAVALKKLNAPIGVYAVLGNHDGYIDSTEMKHALKQNDIIVLSNAYKLVKYRNTPFFIAGTEDMLTEHSDVQKAVPQSDYPIILLSHEPDIFPQVPQHVFLTLSGHTHGGQVNLPFYGAILIPSIYGRKYAEGIVEENRKKIIISWGVGISILPIRFNCFPEIVVIYFE